jgi:hypothetical protein
LRPDGDSLGENFSPGSTIEAGHPCPKRDHRNLKAAEYIAGEKRQEGHEQCLKAVASYKRYGHVGIAHEKCEHSKKRSEQEGPLAKAA